MTDCIFCKIINGEIPSYKIYEDDVVYAFLDISQATPGHTLVVPKKHVKDIFEYDEDLAAAVFARIPKIARAVKASNSEIIGMNILNNNGKAAYQSVFHSHIHLLTRYADAKFRMTFINNEEEYDEAKYKAVQDAIRSQFKD